MISGAQIPRTLHRLLALTAVLTLLATPTHSATPEADSLIARLARPAPASIEFTEVRFSALLRTPLIVSGQLGYDGPASLDRRVRDPYREDTAIRGESVQVEREGEPSRSFALRRAPELRGLLNSFTALLAGDAAAIRRSFDVTVEGEEADWRLVLTPKDARAKRRLEHIIVRGAGDEPHCFSMLNRDGGASVMLLGERSKTSIGPNVTLEQVQQLCSEVGARESGAGSREPGLGIRESGTGTQAANNGGDAPESRIPNPESRISSSGR